MWGGGGGLKKRVLWAMFETRETARAGPASICLISQKRRGRERVCVCVSLC